MSDEREFNIDDILSEFKYNKVVNPEADLSMDELRQKLDRINAIDINLDDLNEQQSFMVEDDGGFKVDLNWVEKPEMTKKQETQDIEDAVVETVETMTQDEDFVEEIIYPKQQVEENSTQTVEENTTATVEEEADVASVIAEEVKTIELEDRAEKSKFDDARFKGFFGKNATEDTVRKEPKPKKIKKPKPTLEEDKIEITDENIVELISKKTAESKTWFIRTLIVLAISIPMIYMTVAPRLKLFAPGFLGYVNSPHWFLFVMSVLSMAVIAVSLPIIVEGIEDIVKLKPNIESVATVSCVVTLLHNLSIMLFPRWGGYLPYCCVSALLMVFVLLSKYMRIKTEIRLLKVSTKAQTPFEIYEETRLHADYIGAMKSTGTDTTVNELAASLGKADSSRKLMARVAPIALISAVVLGVAASLFAGAPQRIMWSLSAMMSVVCPLTTSLCFVLPYSKGVKKAALTGSAIAGVDGIERLAAQKAIIITDHDIFPYGSVALNGVKILGNYDVPKTLSYTASLICASGSGLSDIFGKKVEGEDTEILEVSGLEHYNGGIGGEIEGFHVLLGNKNFMHRMGIKLNEDILVKNAMFLSVDMELVAVFAINYVAQPTIKRALYASIHEKIEPIFATRDFQINANMLQHKFKIASEDINLPQIEDRLNLSDKDRKREGRLCAVAVRNGLAPYVESVIIAKRIKKYTKINNILTIAGCIIGMVLMFFMALNFAPSSASPVNVLIFMLLWCVPEYILSSWVGRY